MTWTSTMKTLSSVAAVLAAVALTAVAATAARAETPAEFYKGKTVSIYVGVAAGGIYSTFAMTLSRHMEKHIPGNPSVIVQHMPGAGGSRANAYVYDVAPKDGTAMVTPNAGVALRMLLGIDKATYDPAKFIWLGGWGEAVNTITLLKDNAPVKTLEEAKKTEVILASIGKVSNTYLIPALIKNTLRTNFKIITGYSGGAPIRLAIERGEVHGWAGQWTGWKLGRPDWVREDRLVHLVQLASKPTPDLPNVPLLSSFAETPEERQIFTAVQTAIADLAIAVPPGVPTDRVAALRTAYEKALRDPEFLKEATARQFEIEPISGDAIQKFVNDLMATPKPSVARMKTAMGVE
jgi:tripartite-type tricarboxylate transporter receptor subunit TctC